MLPELHIFLHMLRFELCLIRWMTVIASTGLWVLRRKRLLRDRIGDITSSQFSKNWTVMEHLYTGTTRSEALQLSWQRPTFFICSQTLRHSQYHHASIVIIGPSNRELVGTISILSMATTHATKVFHGCCQKTLITLPSWPTFGTSIQV